MVKFIMNHMTSRLTNMAILHVRGVMEPGIAIIAMGMVILEVTMIPKLNAQFVIGKPNRP